MSEATYSINRQANGNYVVMDDIEDAPLVSIQFHNQAARVPDDIKLALIKQMFDPEPRGPSVFQIGCWWVYGAATAGAAMFAGFLLRRWLGI